MVQELEYARPCDHCGGRIVMVMDGDRPSYRCQSCGCRWGFGFVLEERGEHCPLAMRTMKEGRSHAPIHKP